MADIDGDDMVCPRSSSTSVKAARGCADIETVAAGGIEAEMIERCNKLERGARHIGCAGSLMAISAFPATAWLGL